jgi:riboflavin biosynthesis pyrimidine reductase
LSSEESLIDSRYRSTGWPARSVTAAHAVSTTSRSTAVSGRCEGGPTLLRHVAAAERLDELCLTVSPHLLGGHALRILDGDLLLPPQDLELCQVLEDDGFLFLRLRRSVREQARDAPPSG